MLPFGNPNRLAAGSREAPQKSALILCPGTRNPAADEWKTCRQQVCEFPAKKKGARGIS